MRELTDSERAAMQTPLREYWVKKDGLLPKETRAFEAGSIAGIEYQKLETAAQIAALQAERDGLREVLENMLYIFDQGYDKADSLGQMRCNEARRELGRGKQWLI